eukprot:TRINITY_DN570_c0_g1_i10.p2 TRINITY_DN570_c0_g1~~TRINITY_DN570_c0_g1_i10.p2  ORF type:complete len:262 (+),score=33.85 TRINITY_DN570_c0_g1_i10:84-869(+)
MIYSTFIALVLVSNAYAQLGLPPFNFGNIFPSGSTPPTSTPPFGFGGNFPSFSFPNPPAQAPQGFFPNFPNSFSDIFGSGSTFGEFGSGTSFPSLSPFVSDLQNVFNEDVVEADVDISFADVDCDTGKSTEFQNSFKAALNKEAGCPPGEDCVEIEEVICGSFTLRVTIIIFVGRSVTVIDITASSEELSASVTTICLSVAAATGNRATVIVAAVAVTQAPVPAVPTPTPSPDIYGRKGYMEEASNTPIAMDSLANIIELQ